LDFKLTADNKWLMLLRDEKPVCKTCGKALLDDQEYYYGKMTKFFWCFNCINDYEGASLFDKVYKEEELVKISFVERLRR